MITDGVRGLLQSSDTFEMIAAVHSWQKLITSVSKHKPDILILDLNIKGDNIIKYLPDFRERFPEPRILIFSSYNTPSLVKKALAEDINGYLLKDTTRDELIEALESVSRDEIYVGARVAVPKKGGRRPHKKSDIGDGFENKESLSERELEVVKYIVEGLPSKQIAEKMFISKYTVQDHRKNIMRKLNVHSAAELVKFALENNLV